MFRILKILICLSSAVALELPDLVGMVVSPLQIFKEPMVEQPRTFLPTTKEIKEMDAGAAQERSHFYLSAFAGTFLAIIASGSGLMVLGPWLKSTSTSYSPASPANESPRHSLSLRCQRMLVGIGFTSTVCSCTAVCLFSIKTGRLSKDYGLDWEIYLALLIAGGHGSSSKRGCFKPQWKKITKVQDPQEA